MRVVLWNSVLLHREESAKAAPCEYRDIAIIAILSVQFYGPVSLSVVSKALIRLTVIGWFNL